MAAQPVTEQGRQTRRRIVAAAATVVAEKGALGASLDDVGARAAASRSQLYHYFDDKTDLLRAVAEATNDTVLDGQQGLFAGMGTWPVSGVGGCPRRVAAAARRARRLPDRQPGRATREHDEPTRAVLAYGFDRWEAHLRAGLAAMVGSGELQADTDVEWLAASTWPAFKVGSCSPKPAGTLSAAASLEAPWRSSTSTADQFGSRESLTR